MLAGNVRRANNSFAATFGSSGFAKGGSGLGASEPGVCDRTGENAHASNAPASAAFCMSFSLFKPVAISHRPVTKRICFNA